MSAQNRKRSPLWDHFLEVESNKAKCNYCGQILSMTSGNVGNLGRHLQTKHPTVPLMLARNNTVQSNPVLSFRTELPPETQPSSDQPGTSALPRNPAQSSIKDYTYDTKPIPLSRAQKIDEQLIKMIAKEFHPLRLVDDKEFQKFVSMLCPGYRLPTRKTLSNTLLPKVYNEIYESAQKKIESTNAVCLATDGWTSINNVSFIAVTAHFIDMNQKGMQLDSILLGCIEFSERHTSSNLRDFLMNIIKDWKLENKVTAIASDNAANITAAIKLGNWRQIPCFAHTLNLCVQAALVNIITITTKVRAIVEFFKRSSHALFKLNEMQKQLGLTPLKLKKDLPTRWNSTYEMIQRICQSKDAVVATVAVMKSELALTDYEWSVIQKAIPILQLFYNVTEEISSEKNVTLSKIIPLCRIIVRHVKSKLMDPGQCNEVKKMLETLDSEIDRRFGSIEYNILCCESTILDPRFKQRGFMDQKRFERVSFDLKQKIGRGAQRLAVLTTIPASQEPQPSTSSTTWHHWDEFDAETSFLQPTNSIAAGIVEFDKYIQEPMLHRTKDPFIWWHERRHVYPLLLQFTLKRLQLVATSVPCERFFSKAGYTLNDRRTRLDSKKLSQILFISHNM